MNLLKCRMNHERFNYKPILVWGGLMVSSVFLWCVILF